jgi:hypothetical protein
MYIYLYIFYILDIGTICFIIVYNIQIDLKLSSKQKHFNYTWFLFCFYHLFPGHRQNYVFRAVEFSLHF